MDGFPFYLKPAHRGADSRGRPSTTRCGERNEITKGPRTKWEVWQENGGHLGPPGLCAKAVRPRARFMDDSARLQETAGVGKASQALGTEVGHWDPLSEWEAVGPDMGCKANHAEKTLSAAKRGLDTKESRSAAGPKGGGAADTYCTMT